MEVQNRERLGCGSGPEAVRHVVQRIQELRTVTLPDGFVALFEDEFKRDRSPGDPQDMFVLRAQDERLALYRFPRPGRAAPVAR